MSETEALAVTVTSNGSSTVTKTVGGMLSVYVAIPKQAACCVVTLGYGGREENVSGVDPELGDFGEGVLFGPWANVMTVGNIDIESDMSDIEFGGGLDDGGSLTGRGIEVLVKGSILRMYLFGNLNALRSSADALTTISVVRMLEIYMARTGVRFSCRVQASVVFFKRMAVPKCTVDLFSAS